MKATSIHSQVESMRTSCCESLAANAAVGKEKGGRSHLHHSKGPPSRGVNQRPVAPGVSEPDVGSVMQHQLRKLRLS